MEEKEGNGDGGGGGEEMNKERPHMGRWRGGERSKLIYGWRQEKRKEDIGRRRG